MATIDFVVAGSRIATESFAIGKIYEIIFTNGDFLICACNHVGNNFVVFQRELPELLFTLNMETASSVRSIEETGGGGGTYNYNNLENKPQINSVELSGNKSSSDLGLQSALDASQLDAVNSGITAAKVTAFEGKQDAITSDNKLSADLVDDTTTTNKFVTAADKTAWNDKQNALTASQLDAVNSGITAAKVTAFEGKQDAITSDNKLSADLVDDTTTTNKFVTAADKTAWNDKQNAIDSLHMLDADLVDDTTANHKFATAAQLSQIETNKNNISTDEAALVELVDEGAKSLLPITATSTTLQGYTYTVNTDGTIDVTGNGSSTTVWFQLNSSVSLKAGKYVLSGGISTSARVIISPTTTLADAIAVSEGEPVEFILNADTNNLIYAIRVPRELSDVNFHITPMLCTKAAWDISRAYQPYRPSEDEQNAQIAHNTNDIATNGLRVVLSQQANSSTTYTYQMKTGDFSAPNSCGCYMISIITWGTTPGYSLYSVAYSGNHTDYTVITKIAGSDANVAVSSNTIFVTSSGKITIIAVK